MSDSFILKLIRESKTSDVHDIATYVWLMIQQKKNTMSNLEIMKIVVSSYAGYQIFEHYVVMTRFPFSVLFYEDETYLSNNDNYMHIPLNNSNFKMFIKSEICNILFTLCNVPTPTEFQRISNTVLKAF